MDECHNLMPSPFGEDSELCKMLRLVAPRFEHRLFLSATPHNGHTRSFTGLLEMLDPVRFSRTREMTPAMRRRIDDVVVRRLKRQINAASSGNGTGAGPRFCTRLPPKALTLKFGPQEARLSAAFDDFRQAVRARVEEKGRPRRSGAFAVEIFGKRLLSCPTAFAESWSRAKEGFDQDLRPAGEKQLETAERSVRQDTGDDREAQQRQATASTVVGAWLQNFADDLRRELRQVDDALERMGFDLRLNAAAVVSQTPIADARFDQLARLIERRLRSPVNGDFRDDERLVVFTEYKTTLDYLARRLRARWGDQRVLTLYGAGGPDGMDESGREHVKTAFNDPNSEVRVLVATDAASEGLNLHRTARYLLHYDCPWNPSRLEQRNGRLDRYGQARDVTVHHFVSDTDPDLRFLDHVVRKADEIREDLGSVNEVFDRAVHRRLIRGEDADDVRAGLDRDVESARGRARFGGDGSTDWTSDRASGGTPNETLDGTSKGTSKGTSDGMFSRIPHEISDNTQELEGTSSGTSNAKKWDTPLDILAAEIDFGAEALRDTLEAAMADTAGRPQLQPDANTGAANGDNGLHRLVNPGLPRWSQVIDESVRRPQPGGAKGPVPALAFSPEPFIERLGELSVFRPRSEALLLHLAHPMMRHALGVLAKWRYPGAGAEESRWVARYGDVPEGADATILLTVEELGVNQLRETFHRWVRTVAFPVRDGELGRPLPHAPARSLRGAIEVRSDEDCELAAGLLDEATPALKKWLDEHKRRLEFRLTGQLETDRQAALARERDRYNQRSREISRLITDTTMDKLAREIEKLKRQRDQGQLFNEAERLADVDRSIEERKQEIDRRRTHHDEIREQLERERDRVLNRLLPGRFALSGGAQAFPVAAEVRLPEPLRRP